MRDANEGFARIGLRAMFIPTVSVGDEHHHRHSCTAPSTTRDVDAEGALE
jgi:hypothetical protein